MSKAWICANDINDSLYFTHGQYGRDSVGWPGCRPAQEFANTNTPNWTEAVRQSQGGRASGQTVRRRGRRAGKIHIWSSSKWLAPTLWPSRQNIFVSCPEATLQAVTNQRHQQLSRSRGGQQHIASILDPLHVLRKCTRTVDRGWHEMRMRPIRRTPLHPHHDHQHSCSVL